MTLRVSQAAVLILGEVDPSTRLTSASVLALGESDPNTRISQLAILFLAPEPPPTRIAQLPILTLGNVDPGVRMSQYGALVLASHIPCVTQWAQCWRIERPDGVVMGFTAHDEPIQFGSVTYSPCYSLNGSAAEGASVLGNVGNQELTGIISDAAISESDLLNGLYDGAYIEVWLVPWGGDDKQGARRIAAGVTGNLSHGEKGFQMEVLTASAKLQQQPLVQLYEPGCRWTFGDARCGVDVTALTVPGSVTTRLNKRSFTDTSRSETNGYFTYGFLRFTSGQNAGAGSEVKSYDAGSKVITLWTEMFYPIMPGDAYEISPGCDKSTTACKSFSNYANFGGFPNVPGRDELVKTPDAKDIG